jgi:uncharacterized protein (TIGR02147 family)
MKQTIFEYRDYKKYLSDWIHLRPRRGHGEKSRIADALRCHVAYVSQVLKGAAHFSPEQAEILNRYLNHGEEEADFFMLLVHYGRAGTRALEKYYEAKLTKAVEKRLVLKERLEFKKTLSLEDQAIYYSAWYYAAIHLLVAIPAFRDKEALARYLGISAAQVTKALEFLVVAGLVRQEGGGYLPGTTNIHLSHDSPMIAKHHINWRMQVIQSLDTGRQNELHYSSVVTIARKDALRIHDMLIQAIEKVRAVVRESPEEELYCYALDLFRVGKEQFPSNSG